MKKATEYQYVQKDSRVGVVIICNNSVCLVATYNNGSRVCEWWDIEACTDIPYTGEDNGTPLSSFFMAIHEHYYDEIADCESADDCNDIAIDRFLDFTIKPLRWLTNTSKLPERWILCKDDDADKQLKNRNEWLKNLFIGPPQKTDRYSVDELINMGMVGVYGPNDENKESC